MATGVTLSPLLQQQVEEILAGDPISSPLAPAIVETQTELSEVVTQAAADSYSVGMTTSDQVTVRAIAQAYIRDSQLAGLQASVSAYQTLAAAHAWLQAVLARMPRVISGPGQRILSELHKPIEVLGQSIARKAVDAARTMLHDRVATTGWAANQSGFVQRLIADAGLAKPVNYHGTGPLSPADAIAGMERSINYLLTQVDKLQVAIGPLQHAGAVPTNLPGQIRSMQAQIFNLQQHALQLDARINTVERAVQIQNNQIAQLSHGLHGLRQVSTGWQDVKQAVDTLARQMQQEHDDISHKQAQDHAQLSQLLPLALLLQPGMPGLRNLRQLEDTPCMCPKMPDISGVTGELLALYEFVTHG